MKFYDRLQLLLQAFLSYILISFILPNKFTRPKKVKSVLDRIVTLAIFLLQWYPFNNLIYLLNYRTWNA